MDIVPINVLDMPDPASDPSHSSGLLFVAVEKGSREFGEKTHLGESSVISNFVAEKSGTHSGMQAVATDNEAACDCLAVLKHRCNRVICILECRQRIAKSKLNLFGLHSLNKVSGKAFASGYTNPG